MLHNHERNRVSDSDQYSPQDSPDQSSPGHNSPGGGSVEGPGSSDQQADVEKEAESPVQEKKRSTDPFVNAFRALVGDSLSEFSGREAPVPANHLDELGELKNRYLILRHGQAESNIGQVYMSDAEEALLGFGLTEEGREQVLDSVIKAFLRDRAELNEQTIIVTSPLTRARETAEIARQILCTADPVIVTPLLKERGYGELENTCCGGWEDLVESDRGNPNSKHKGAESPRQVMERMTRLIQGLEEEFADRTILLVSHSVAMCLLRCAFEQRSAGEYMDQSYPTNAEIWRLERESPAVNENS